MKWVESCGLVSDRNDFYYGHHHRPAEAGNFDYCERLPDGAAVRQVRDFPLQKIIAVKLSENLVALGNTRVADPEPDLPMPQTSRPAVLLVDNHD